MFLFIGCYESDMSQISTFGCSTLCVVYVPKVRWAKDDRGGGDEVEMTTCIMDGVVSSNISWFLHVVVY